MVDCDAKLPNRDKVRQVTPKVMQTTLEMQQKHIEANIVLSC